jgi:hypothetical protein
MSEVMHLLRLPANLQTTNLGVGSSNLSGRANEIKYLQYRALPLLHRYFR